MVYTYAGTNDFGRQQAVRQHMQRFSAAHGDMALQKLDAADATADEIREALQSAPFLADRKLVVIRSGASNKSFAEQASDLLQDLADTTEVVLDEPKLDKRSTYYKFIHKNTEFSDFAALDTRGLAAWAVGYAKDLTGQISRGDAQYLVERVGPDQQLIASELKKLLITGKPITKSLIDTYTEPNPQSTIFELLDAAFQGKAEQALRIYEEQRQLKVDPHYIIAMLIWQLHIVAILVAGQGMPVDDVAKKAKISPYVAKKSQGIARRVTKAQLLALLERLIAIDVQSKSTSLNLDDALKHYILLLAQK